MKTTITQTMIAAIALIVGSPAIARPHTKPHRAAAKGTKAAKPAKPKTAMQAMAPPVPEGPAAAPASTAAPTADADASMPGARGVGSAATRGAIPVAAVVGPVSAAQAACAGSQGQNVAIPDGYGSQTTRCGANASLGRVDARVDFRVRPPGSH